jgi:HEAT repeat protein
MTAFDQHAKHIESLAAELNNPDEEVYGRTTSALAKIGNEQAIEILINEVHQQDDRRRNVATNKLIRIGEPSVPALKDAFYNSSGRTRAYFLKALGKIGGGKSLGVFRDALLDENYDVFWVVTAIYREVNDPQAIPALIAYLKHEDDFRQTRAAKALFHTGDKRALNALKQVVIDENRNEITRHAAMLTLGKLGKTEAIPTLLESLKNSDPNVRWSALIGLSYTGEPQIIEFLLDLANKYPENVLYHTPIKNLGSMGDQSTLNELERIFQNEHYYDSRVEQTAKESMEQLRKRLTQ